MTSKPRKATKHDYECALHALGQQSMFNPEPEVIETHIFENFTLEGEYSVDENIRWAKITQPNNDEYLFRVTIETIKKENK